jgi:hypothetical protein
MKTAISTIISITFVATILVTMFSLVNHGSLWFKRRKYNKFVNPKNTEKMLQEELASEFQKYINTKQQKSRREHPTNYHRNSLDNETRDIISRIPKHKEDITPPRRDEFNKFIATKYRNPQQPGE